MLWGAHTGSLELRTEGGETRLRAIFPYGRAAVLSDGGRTGRQRQEVIAARAFADRIDRGDDILFLAGHDFNKPLASREAGTLSLSESDDALNIGYRDFSLISAVPRGRWPDARMLPPARGLACCGACGVPAVIRCISAFAA
jgi:hypothetical protein